MKKVLRMLTSRVAVVAVLVVLQLIWLCTFFFGAAQYWIGIDIALKALSVLMVLYLVRKDLTPAYKIAWILLCCLAPLLGGALYLLFGDKRPSKQMRDRMEKVKQQHLAAVAQPMDIQTELPPRQQALTNYIAQFGPNPAREQTKSDYYPTGEAAFEVMLQDLEKAEHFIFLEYFIISEGKLWQQVFEILKRKAAQGVDVRVIYDDIGSAAMAPDHLTRELRKNGIRCISFNPALPLLAIVMNHRDHRKITVVDGYIGYTGGINIADEYINQKERFGYWKDTAVRLEGAAVWNLTVMFLQMWNAFDPIDGDFAAFAPHVYGGAMPETDGIVQPFCESPLEDEMIAEGLYLDVLAQATDYVYIFTPYLIIDHELMVALSLAAKRGVDVRIGVPGIPDKPMVYRLTRSYFSPLLRAGVKIYTYTPGFLHAKGILSDDCIGMVGTINLDYRSLYLHFEDGVLFQGGSILQEIKKDYLDVYEQQSHRVQLKECKDTFWGRLLDDVLRLVSPMM